MPNDQSSGGELAPLYGRGHTVSFRLRARVGRDISLLMDDRSLGNREERCKLLGYNDLRRF